jgi:pseudouridylate synthase
VRVDTPEQAADLLAVHWALEGTGMVLAQPVAAAVEIDSQVFNALLAQAEGEAAEAGVRGPALTPFLLARLAEATQGQTLRANQALIVANARLAAQVAAALTARGT